MLAKLALGAAGVTSGAVSFRLPELGPGLPSFLSPQDDQFLEELERASFRLFWESAHPATGLVKNLARVADRAANNVSSIAATGFGLTGLCFAAERGWVRSDAARERVRRTLRFLWSGMPQRHGFYYHFVNWSTGDRAWQSEVSSIDTALLLCGVLTCRQHFPDAEIQTLATDIFNRVDWQWLYQNGPFLLHGWRPEGGFLKARWDTYSEHMMLYLLALGANEHAIPAEAWNAWRRPVMNYGEMNYIDAETPLFIHQYSHAWFDFQNRRDAYADYFENSVVATRAHRRFCEELAEDFPDYSRELWGITASESPHGYVVWGGPPRQGPIDGSVVPCAAGGSLPFLTGDCLATLRAMRERFGRKIWVRFGFADAFNPATGWVSPEHVAINTGITLLMAENTRTGFVWKAFMKNPEVQAGLARAGFGSPAVV
jgi:hypothetical protein